MSLQYSQMENRAVVIGTVLFFPNEDDDNNDDMRILPRPNRDDVSEFVINLNHLDDAFDREQESYTREWMTGSIGDKSDRLVEFDDENERLPDDITVYLRRDSSAVDSLRNSRHRSRAILRVSDRPYGTLANLWEKDCGALEFVKHLRFLGGALPELRGNFATDVPLEQLTIVARWRDGDRWHSALPTSLLHFSLDLTQVDKADRAVVAQVVQQRARDYPTDPFTEWRTGLFSRTMLLDVNAALPHVLRLPNLVTLLLRLRRLRGTTIRLRPLQPQSSVFLPLVAQNLTALSLQAETLDAPVDLFAPLVNLRRYMGALPHPMGNYMRCQTTLEFLSITHSASIYDVPAHITQFSSLRGFSRSWPNAITRDFIELHTPTLVTPPLWGIELAWPVQIRNMSNLTPPALPVTPHKALPYQSQPTTTTAPTFYTLDRTTSKAIATLRHVGIVNIDAIVGILASAFPLHGQTQFISRAIAHQFASMA